MDSSKVHSLGCNIDDDRTRDILASITALPSLARPAVCLPDLHLKERTEAPSSFAAATRDTIVPELTAPSVGCGMGALITSLSVKDIDHTFFEAFFHELRANLGPRYGHFKNILLWLGIIGRPHKPYDLTEEEFADIIKRGAEAAVERYNLPAEFLDRVEYRGSVFSKEERESLNLKNILPRISWRSGRHDLGYGFKGNHFLEIQYVEEMIDIKTARDWGLKEGSIVIMYHGGGGAVSYHIGRYFGNRKKNTAFQKFVLFFFKALFHFGNPKNWKYAAKRFRYYFHPKPFMEIPLGTPEGDRLWQATKASLNYSYGFRMAIARRLIDTLNRVSPKKGVSASLIVDSTHNAIMKEKVGNEELIVHRHTANRAFPDKPLIVSGFNTTNSYIAVGLPNAEEHLFASDHGAGITIKKMQDEGLSRPHPKNFVTHIYQTRSPFKRVVEHITNEGIDYVMETLEREGIARPVARLRPLAVFKG